MGWIGAFVAKNFEATSWHKLLHQFRRFCTEFCNSNKRPQMHQNCTKSIKTWVQIPMGWIACVGCEKFRRDFVARTSAPSFKSQPNSPKCTKIVRSHKNMSLGSNGVYRGRWLQKIPTRLRGMNFCTSSARFAPSFVSQLNGPKCTKNL